MNAVIRAGRVYWQWNELLWRQIRKAAVPILAVFGVASVALFFVGLNTGNALLLWAPAYWAWTLSLGHMVSRLPR